MTSKVFTSGTIIDSAWLNDVNRRVYGPIQSTDALLTGFLQSGTGAVATTAQDELRSRVRIEQFGGAGDGVTVNTTAYNNAIAKLGATGGFLEFGPGIYILNSVNLPSNIHLVGAGAGITVLQFGGNGITRTGTSGTPVLFGGIRDMSIKGAFGGGGTGLDLAYAQLGYYSNIDVQGFANGLNARNSWTNAFYRARLNQNTVGAQIYQNSNAFMFYGGSLTNNTNTGIIIRGCWNVCLYGTDIEQNLARGAIIRGHLGEAEADIQTSNINFIGCYIEENGTSGGNNGAHFEIGGYLGVADTNQVVDVHIDKNIFYASNTTMDSGIIVLNADGTTITDNTGLIASTYVTARIGLKAASRRTLIKNNRLALSDVVVTAGATFHEDMVQNGTVTISTDGTGAGFADVTLKAPYPVAPVVNCITALVADSPAGLTGALSVRNLTVSSFRLRIIGGPVSTTVNVNWEARGVYTF